MCRRGRGVGVIAAMQCGRVGGQKQVRMVRIESARGEGSVQAAQGSRKTFALTPVVLKMLGSEHLSRAGVADSGGRGLH